MILLEELKVWRSSHQVFICLVLSRVEVLLPVSRENNERGDEE